MTPPTLPADHDQRMSRVRLAVDGLSVGDAFGQQYFYPPALKLLLPQRQVPAPPWHYTDDTEMALAIAEVLQSYGQIEQTALATGFSRRFQANPHRGYGGMAIAILSALNSGYTWEQVSPAAFDGMGSMGNGGAMRVAPVGAYFADDFARAAEQSHLSAEVTHAHLEGQAGAIAIGVAAAWATQSRAGGSANPADLFEAVLAFTPQGQTRCSIEQGRDISLDMPVSSAASLLGNGSQVVSQDTVPFCLWCIARHLDEYEEAMWETVSGLGDRDTTCAIVGGVVALACGPACIPEEWLSAREPLDYHG